MRSENTNTKYCSMMKEWKPVLRINHEGVQYF